MCFTPLDLKNSVNLFDVNCGPLSDTSCSGNPKAAKPFLSMVMVLSDVVDAISKISHHLE